MKKCAGPVIKIIHTWTKLTVQAVVVHGQKLTVQAVIDSSITQGVNMMCSISHSFFFDTLTTRLKFLEIFFLCGGFVSH